MAEGIKTALEDLHVGNPANDRLIFLMSDGWADTSITSIEAGAWTRDGTRSGGHALAKQPLYIDSTLQRAQALVDIMYKTSHSSPTRSRIGGASVEGPFNFALTAASAVDILRWVMQDLSPSSVHLGRINGSLIEVLQATDITGTITIDNNLSSVDQELEVSVVIDDTGRLTKQFSLTAADVADDATINGLTYKGEFTTANRPTASTATELILIIDSAGNPVRFEVSSGDSSAFEEVDIDTALGAAGKFLGRGIAGAESDSENVNSADTAEAFFDADISRYAAANTYYIYDGGDLQEITVVAAGSGTADGVITITGTDSAGATQSETFTYKDYADLLSIFSSRKKFASVTAASQTGFADGDISIEAVPYTTRGNVLPGEFNTVDGASIASDGKISIENDLGIIENPVKLTVTPSNATIKSGEASAKITITGENRLGNEIVRTKTYTSAPSAYITSSAFARITKVEVEGFGDNSELTIAAQDTATEWTIELQDELTKVFMDCEMDKSGAPFTYRSLLAQSFAMSVGGREEAISAAVDVIGYSGGGDYENIGGDSGTTARKTDISNAGIELVDPDINIGWESTFKVAGVDVPMLNCSVAIAQNYLQSNVIAGVQEQPVAPYRDGKRETMLESSIQFSRDNPVAKSFAENEQYEEVVIENKFTDPNSFEETIRLEIDEAQLTTHGDPPSPESGQTTIPFTLRAYGTDFETPSDIRAVITTTRHEYVKQYS